MDLSKDELESLPLDGVGPLVLVRWVDTSGKSRWTSKEEIETSKVMEIETVARIVNQTSGLLRVASSRDPYSALSDTTTIPMVNVLEIVYLRPFKRKTNAPSQ